MSDDLLKELVSWFQENVERAQARGVSLELAESPPGRPKPAMWIAARRGQAEAQLTVWSSGEAEYDLGSPDTAVVSEHHELRGRQDLHRLLNRLISSL